MKSSAPRRVAFHASATGAVLLVLTSCAGAGRSAPSGAQASPPSRSVGPPPSEEPPPIPDVWLRYTTDVNPGSAIQFVDQQVGWRLDGQGSNPHLDGALASGPHGTIFNWPGDSVSRSTDGGATWKSMLKDQNGIWGIDALSATAAWAVGVLALFRTQDGGASWKQVGEPAGKPLVAVSFANQLAGLGVTDDGTVVSSSDGGVTWSASDSPGAATAICLSPQGTGFLTTPTGDVYSTTDLTNWTLSEQAPITVDSSLTLAPYWSSIACDGTNVVQTTEVLDPFLHGHSSNPNIVTYSGDGGATWTVVSAFSDDANVRVPNAPSTVNAFAFAMGAQSGVAEVGFPPSGWQMQVLLAGRGGTSPATVPTLPTSTNPSRADQFVEVHGGDFVGATGWLFVNNTGLGTQNSAKTQTVVLQSTDGGSTWKLISTGPITATPSVTLVSPSPEP